MKRTTSHIVARDRSADGSPFGSKRLATCFLVRAWLWWVHSGEAIRTSVEGYRRGSTWETSAQSWSASGKLLLCVSMASDQ